MTQNTQADATRAASTTADGHGTAPGLPVRPRRKLTGQAPYRGKVHPRRAS